MPIPRMNNERGIALLAAVFALVVIEALVAGTFFLGRLEQQAGAGAVALVQAGAAADAGLARAVAEAPTTYLALATWTPAANNELVLPTASIGGNPLLVATPMVRRLNTNLFLIRSVGQRLGQGGQVLATAEHGLLVRIAKTMGAAAVRPVGPRSWMQLY